jgi:serine protease
MNSRISSFLSICFLTFLIPGFVLSQMHQVPGRVYFKVRSGSEAIPIFSGGKPASLPSVWEAICHTYEVNEIVKPFHSPNSELQKIYRLQFNPQVPASEVCEALQALGVMQYVEPAQRYFSSQVPNDVDSRQQWYLDLIDAFDAWDIGTGNSMAPVAIVDDAVKTDHPDLSPIIWTNPGEIAGNSLDDDNNGFVDDVNGFDVADNDNDARPPASGLWQLLGLFTHGTHCAGIAGAATNNGLGIASVGNGIRIIPVKATSNSSLIPLAIDNGNEGVDYAVASGARVISMSWGGATQDSTLTNVIQAAVDAGRILVSAAGNDGNTNPNYPSALPGVICVGSVSRGDIVSSFSQRGSMIDVMAPGDSIWSTLATSANYGFQSGTSMACPMVAGLCGLMLSQNPGFDANTIESCLKSSADNIDALNSSLIGQMGAGRINAQKAMECLFLLSEASNLDQILVKIFPNPGQGSFTVHFEEMEEVSVYSASGSRMFYLNEIHQSQISIPTSNWESGIYWVRATSKNGISRSAAWVRY